MPILHYTVVLSKIQSKEKMDLPQGHPKIMPKAEFRPPSLWLDTHTSTKRGVGSTADKDLLSHFGVVFLKSSNYRWRDCGAWRCSVCLGAFHCANGVAQSEQAQQSSAHPGLGLGKVIRVIPPWTSRPQNKDNQCPAVLTLIAASCSETWKYPIIPVSGWVQCQLCARLWGKMYRLVLQNEHNAWLHWLTIFQSALPIFLTQSQHRHETKMLSVHISQWGAHRLKGMALVTASGGFTMRFALLCIHDYNYGSDWDIFIYISNIHIYIYTHTKPTSH